MNKFRKTGLFKDGRRLQTRAKYRFCSRLVSGPKTEVSWKSMGEHSFGAVNRIALRYVFEARISFVLNPKL